MPFGILLSSALATNLSNAQAAEPMTALGLYIHAFFLVLVLGLAPFVLILEALGIRKKDRDYTHGAKIISQVWAVSFAFGSITGTLIEFGLYLVWPGTILAISSFWFVPFLGDLFAFLIEASFLIAYLHFWGKINPWLHWTLGWGLMLGAFLSAFVILAANAWLQMPWGTGSLVHSILPWVPNLGPNVVNATAFQVLRNTQANTGVLNLANFAQARALGYIIYNPLVAFVNPNAIVTSFHTVLAAIIVAGFETAGIFSYMYLRRGTVAMRPFYLKIMKAAYGMGGIAMFAEAFAGDQMARIVYTYQKLQFVIEEGIPPKGGIDPPIGVLLYANPFHYFPGYDNFNATASQSIDPSAVIQSVAYAQSGEPLINALYYLMVVSGMILAVFGFAFFGLYSRKIDKLVRFVTTLSTERFLLYSSLIAPWLALAAGGAGWFIREDGRHPWTVYGLLQFSQIIAPFTITPEFTALIIAVELLILAAGLLALYYIPTKALEKAREELVIIRG
jgi:cytochrome bd ubiquinol oxidase subunit I